jgi:hypothetical protein
VKTASQLDKLRRFQRLEYGAVQSAQSLKMYPFPARTRQTRLQRHCLGPVLAATLKPGWSDVEHVEEGQGARQERGMIAVPE